MALMVPAGIAKTKLPAFKGYVNDYVGVMDADREELLKEILEELEKKTDCQVVVAIVETSAPLDIKTYSIRLAKKWNVGKVVEFNTGVLILVAKEDRQMHIEVGYGLRSKLTGRDLRQMIDSQFLPRLKQDGYSDGVFFGTVAVAKHVAGAHGVILMSAGSSSIWHNADGSDSVLAKAVMWIILFPLMVIIVLLHLTIYRRIFCREPYWLGLFRFSSGGRFRAPVADLEVASEAAQADLVALSGRLPSVGSAE